MTELITLITRKMLELGGGIIPISTIDAARLIGITQPALTRILQGDRNPNPRSAILLARWLGQPIPDLLTLCGHADLIALLAPTIPPTPPTDTTHPAVRAFARAIHGHTSATITAALSAATAVLSVAHPAKEYN